MSPSWSRRDKRLVLLWALLVVTSLWCFWSTNYEVIGNGVLSGDTFYYGGYAQEFITEGTREPISFHSEALGNYQNILRLLSSTSSGGYVQRFTSTDRLLSSWLSAVITAGSFGYITPYTSFLVQDIVLWFIAMVLMFHLGRIFVDRTTGIIAASLLAVHPVHTLMFQSTKVAVIGSVYLLLMMVVYEVAHRSRWAYARWTAMLFSAMLLGFYCGGGTQFLLVYLLGRAIASPRTRFPLISAVIGVCAFVITHQLVRTLNAQYYLVLQADENKLGAFFLESFSYLRSVVQTGTPGGHEFFGRPGWEFWTTSIPIHVRSHLLTNPFVLLIGSIGLWWRRSLRVLLVPAVALLSAHLGPLLLHWSFVYGYLIYPSSLLTILGFAAIVSTALQNEHNLMRNAACMLMAVSLAWYSIDALPGVRHQLDLYYGGNGVYPSKRVIAIFPETS